MFLEKNIINFQEIFFLFFRVFFNKQRKNFRIIRHKVFILQNLVQHIVLDIVFFNISHKLF